MLRGGYMSDDHAEYTNLPRLARPRLEVCPYNLERPRGAQCSYPRLESHTWSISSGRAVVDSGTIISYSHVSLRQDELIRPFVVRNSALLRIQYPAVFISFVDPRYWPRTISFDYTLFLIYQWKSWARIVNVRVVLVLHYLFTDIVSVPLSSSERH